MVVLQEKAAVIAEKGLGSSNGSFGLSNSTAAPKVSVDNDISHLLAGSEHDWSSAERESLALAGEAKRLLDQARKLRECGERLRAAERYAESLRLVAVAREKLAGRSTPEGTSPAYNN